MNITLADGSGKQYADGTTPLAIAGELSGKLAKNALAAEVNGELRDINRPLHADAALKILTFEDEGGRWALRHTGSHIMAQAVKRLYPGAKLAIGPAIDNGFYYDFDVERPFSTEDLSAIEAEMNKIIAADLPLEYGELARADAISFFEKQGEPYKVELIEDLPEGEIISTYRQGEFIDLCAGPHAPSTGRVKFIKLLSVAGAYWRGSEKNKMLQRIYGTAFTKKEELDLYVTRIEEAKKRDHRRLGKELDLFAIFDEGPGFPFFLPKGMALRNVLEDFWRSEHKKRGYEEIKTPIILNKDLWIRSGHWDHYKDNMYYTTIDDEDYCVKPMNCPGSLLVYKRKMYSYRDLPLRMAELGLVHRHELSGALHGLMRVRCFTQDDSHKFMTPEHIRDEVAEYIDKFEYIYSVFGFKYRVELSTRPENSMGGDEAWEIATSALKSVLEERGIDFVVNEGDGAFYGPKIDYHLEDAIGRTWQCGTIQLDFQMPERFELTYVGPDGEKHQPVMLHSTVLGSIERFIGILIEHFVGAFPTWIAPVQVKLLSITDRAAAKISELETLLSGSGFRVETDIRNEKIGFKIREAQMEKIPYMLVVGDKEIENDVVAVRSRKSGDIGTMIMEDFIVMLKQEIDAKAL